MPFPAPGFGRGLSSSANPLKRGKGREFASPHVRRTAPRLRWRASPPPRWTKLGGKSDPWAAFTGFTCWVPWQDSVTDGPALSHGSDLRRLEPITGTILFQSSIAHQCLCTSQAVFSLTRRSGKKISSHWVSSHRHGPWIDRAEMVRQVAPAAVAS